MIEERLKELGISLSNEHHGCTVQCKRWKDLLFISGTLSTLKGKAGGYG